MTTFLQLLFSGVSIGLIYGLVGLGFVVLFKATGVFNFSQGILMAAGGFLGVITTRDWNLSFVPSLIAVGAASFVIGALIYLVLMRLLEGRALMPVVMATFALAMTLKSVLEMSFGPVALVLDSGLPSSTTNIGGVRMANTYLITGAVALICFAAFLVFFRSTSVGLRMRAVADDPSAAILCGVNLNRANTLAWALSTMLAGIAGMLLGELQLVSTNLEIAGLLALPAVVIGGVQSVPGAVVGGVLVGVLQQMGTGYISSDASEVVVYLPLLLIVLFRPWGLFGERELIRG